MRPTRHIILVGAVTVAIGGTAASLPAAATDTTPTFTTANQHEIIPLYVYPDIGSRSSVWARACTSVNATVAGSIIIANGNSGPTTTRDPNYATAIAYCQNAGQRVIGYVDTGYGKVPLATAEHNVDLWLNQYPDLAGIFFDELSTNPSAQTYEHALYQYVSARGKLVIGNPGAPAATDWQLAPTTKAVDVLMIWENYPSALKSYRPPAWVSRYPASSLAMLVHDSKATSSAVQTSCTYLKRDNAGYVDVTNFNGYWINFQSAQMVSWMRQYCG